MVLLCVFSLGASVRAFSEGDPAQQPALISDLGENNLLLVACNDAKDEVERAGYTMKFCRQTSPPVVAGNLGEVGVRVYLTNGYDVRATVKMRKTLWNIYSIDPQH